MIIKKIISTVAAFTIAISAIPYTKTKAKATSKGNNINTHISVVGENAIGNIISSDISDALTQEMDNTTNRIISIEMDGNEATVDYEIEHDCSLVVGIYTDDDDKQLVAKCEKDISNEDNNTSLIFSDPIPEYYYVKAYLIDSETYRPLSQCYESAMYTKEIQELMDDTINDYDENKVINLDEDTQTNFVVLADDIIRFDSSSANIVMADDEKLIYSFENPDEKVSSISIGQIFVYNGNEGELLIVKVADIKTKDNIITFYGEDTTAEEVFDYVKIEASRSMDEAEIEDTDLPDGVNLVSQPSRYPKPKEYEFSSSKSITYEFGKIPNTDGDNKDGDKNKPNFDIGLTGSFTLSVEVSLKLYITLKKQFCEFKLSYNETINVKLSGELKKSFPLNPMKYVFIKDVFYANINVSFVVEASGALVYSNYIEGAIGIQVEHEGLKKPSCQNISIKPSLKNNEDINFEGDLFIGVEFKPEAGCFRGLAEIEFSAKAGITVHAALNIFSLKNDTNQIHECKKCIEGEIGAILTLSAKVELLENVVRISKERDIIEAKLFDFHYSFDYDEGGLSPCPHYKYRLTVIVKDHNKKKPVKDATINCEGNIAVTDDDGRASIYVKKGEHNYEVSCDGFNTAYKDVIVVEPRTIGVELNTATSDSNNNNKTEQTYQHNGHSYYVYSGVAGTIEKAKLFCEQKGGYLAVINNKEENDFLYKLTIHLGYNNGAYFGYSDSDDEGHWRWLGNNERSTYENWAPGEPNGGNIENTAMFWNAYRDGKWNDGDFGAVSAFICEWDNGHDNTLHTKQNYNGHSYQLIDKNLSWLEAQDYCKKQGGHLVSITSDGEQQFIESLFNDDISYTCYWIGLFRSDDTWSWIDGTPYEYSNWDFDDIGGTQKPDNYDGSENYVGIYSVTQAYDDWKQNFGKWDDGSNYTPSGYANGFICEWDTENVANNSTTKPLPPNNNNVKLSDEEMIEDLTIPEQRTVSYNNLIPNNIYNFYVMKSKDAESPLSNNNLLYINQYVSDENGNLTITYTPLGIDLFSDAFLVGYKGIDISNAIILVHDLSYTGDEQFADVRVALDDKELIEGLDYDICGDYIAKDSGHYNVRIIGRGEYEGNVSAEYSIINSETNSKITTTLTTTPTTTSIDPVTSTTTGVTTSTKNNSSQTQTTTTNITATITTFTTTSPVYSTSTTTVTTTATTINGSQPFTTTSNLTTVPATSTASVTTTTSTGTTQPVVYTLGDVNNDGKVNAVDASTVLTYYANISTNKDGGFDDNQKAAADVDHDGKINAVDASNILSYYAYVSTTKEEIISMEDYMKKAA